MLTKDILRKLPGQIIFTQGEPADSVFYIRSGGVEINITHYGIKRTIAYLHPGEFFGEHCLSSNPYRPNTATALKRTTLIQIEKCKMGRALLARPILREMFIRNLIDHKMALEISLIQMLNVELAWPHADLQ